MEHVTCTAQRHLDQMLDMSAQEAALLLSFVWKKVQGLVRELTRQRSDG